MKEIKHLTCPKCTHPSFTSIREDNGLRAFSCLSCKHTWTSGFSGGHYILSKYLKRTGIDHD